MAREEVTRQEPLLRHLSDGQAVHLLAPMVEQVAQVESQGAQIAPLSYQLGGKFSLTLHWLVGSRQDVAAQVRHWVAEGPEQVRQEEWQAPQVVPDWK